MKKIISLLFLLATSTFAYTQDDYYDLDPSWYDYEYCLDHEIHDEIVQLTDSILNELGLEKNFKFLNCPNFQNAAAVILPSRTNFYDKERYIIYDWDFLQKCSLESGSELTILVILIHEIGHHLNGDPLNIGGSTPEIELQADQFVGSTVAMLGGSITDAFSAYRVMPDPLFNFSHPPRALRLLAVERGFRNYMEKHPSEVVFAQDVQKAELAFGAGLNSETAADKIEQFTFAISHNLHFSKAYFERGQVLMEQELFELAEADFLAVLKFESKNTDALSKLAWAMLKQGKEDAAISLLEKMSQNPAIASTMHYIKAMAQVDEGDALQAEYYFSKAIESNPSCEVETYFQRALVRQELGRHDDAIQDLNRVILDSPANWEALIAKGESLLLLGNAKAALENLKVAYKFTRHDTQLLLLLATASFEIGNKNDALRYVDRHLLEKPSLQGYLLLAKIHVELDGSLLSALNACGRAFSFDSKNVEVLDMLNVVVEKMNRQF